jgi:hypothetical protein
LEKDSLITKKEKREITIQRGLIHERVLIQSHFLLTRRHFAAEAPSATPPAVPACERSAGDLMGKPSRFWMARLERGNGCGTLARSGKWQVIHG